MKQLTAKATCRGLLTLLMITLFQALTWAQDNSGSDGSSASSTVTKTTHSVTSSSGDAFYTNPWVWVVGAAVFILLLVALLRGNSSTSVSRTDRVVVSKTSSDNI
jgi:hypothetical protein